MNASILKIQIDCKKLMQKTILLVLFLCSILNGDEIIQMSYSLPVEGFLIDKHNRSNYQHINGDCNSNIYAWVKIIELNKKRDGIEKGKYFGVVISFLKGKSQEFLYCYQSSPGSELTDLDRKKLRDLYYSKQKLISELKSAKSKEIGPDIYDVVYVSKEAPFCIDLNVKTRINAFSKYVYLISENGIINQIDKQTKEGKVIMLFDMIGRSFVNLLNNDGKINLFYIFQNGLGQEDYWTITRTDKDGNYLNRWRLKNIRKDKIKQYGTVTPEQYKQEMERQLRKLRESKPSEDDKAAMENYKKVYTQRKHDMELTYRLWVKNAKELEEKRKKYKDPFKGCSVTFNNQANDIIKSAVNKGKICLFDKEMNKFLVINTDKNTCSEYKSNIDFEEGKLKFTDMIWLDGKLICVLKVARKKEFKFCIYDFDNKKYYISEINYKLPSDLHDPELSIYDRKENEIAVTTKSMKEIPIYKLNWDKSSPKLKDLEEIN